MTRSNWVIFTVILSFSWITNSIVETYPAVAGPPACSVEVATAELHSIHDDLMLQDLLRDQQVNNHSVEKHIAFRILKRIMVLRATSVDVTALRRIPVEALCLLTTDGVQARLAMVGDDELLEVAISYLDAIEPEVREEVSRIQQTMLGTGCSLSP